MGLFGKKDKGGDKQKENAPAKEEKKILKTENVHLDEEINASGWDAITAEFERIYPEQVNPMHYGCLIRWMLGGPDPLDGISVYDGGDYWHFVSYGLSELYEKESKDLEYSGYGMEFTFKLKKVGFEDLEQEILCVRNNLQNIARLTFENGELFLPNEYVYTGQTEGIDREQKSKLTGFITINDPSVNTLNTPNGKVEFVEFIGVTDSELKAIMEKRIRVRELYDKLGTDVTDYCRDSVI